MRHWLFIAGMPPEGAQSTGRRFAEFRRVFAINEFDVLALRGTEHAELMASYRELTRDFVRPNEWLGLVGEGSAGEDLVRSYYDFISVRTPDALALIEPKLTAHDLNEVTCPFYIVSSRNDPVLKEATAHHLQRYTDTSELRDSATQARIASWFERTARLSARRSRKLAA